MKLRALLFALLLASSIAVPQEAPSATENPSSTAPVNQTTGTGTTTTPVQQPEEKSLVYRPEAIPDTSVFEPSASAKNFKFGKIDLGLLKQVDAFDKYMEDHGFIYNDAVVTGYVERVGRSVVPPNPPENVQWRFRVIRDPVPNAFALPNGSIYIHTGLLSRLQNEAQLAGVLAHESTHVFNRHTYASYHDMRKKVVAIEVIQVGATAASLGGVSAGVVGAMGNLIPMIVAETVFGYRRELERESDQYAVKVMKNAGYDPAEMSKALDSLRNGPEVDLSQESAFWSDHPKLDERVNDTTRLAKQVGEPPHGGKTGQLDYVASTKNAIRHDASMAMMLGRPRTAVSIAERLIEWQPNDANHYALLGDAYRALGARPAQPTAEELTENGKKKARKMLSRMTQAEYEKALLEAPGGKQQFDANCKLALEAYGKALALDANNPLAVRGMGFLDETEGLYRDALVNFTRYLQLAPDAKDARLVRQRMEKIQKLLDQNSSQGAGQ